MCRELNNIYLDRLVCLLTGEQTEPLAGDNVRAQHRVMDTSIERWRAGCIQTGGSPRGESTAGVKAFSLPADRLLRLNSVSSHITCFILLNKENVYITTCVWIVVPYKSFRQSEV